MDLNSTRTAANTIQPEEVKPQKYGERLLDFYAKKSDSWSDEYKDPERFAQDSYARASDRDRMDYDTWKAFHGVNDFIAKAPEAAAQYKEKLAFDAAQPESRGVLSSMGTALARGGVGVVEQAGRFLSSTDLTPDIVDEDKGYLDTIGKGMVDWAQETKANSQIMRQSKEEERGELGYTGNGTKMQRLKGGIMQGVESIPLSAATGVGALAGATVAPAIGIAATTGAAIGGSVALGALFFGGTYDQAYEDAYKEVKTKNPGISEEDAKKTAFNVAAPTGGLEVITEGASDLAATAVTLNIPGLKQAAKAGIKSTINAILKPGVASFLKTFGKAALKQAPFEVGSEMINAAGQDYVKEINNLDHDGALTAAMGAVVPSLVTTIGMGGAMAGVSRVRAGQIANNLNNENAEVRIKAIQDTAQRLYANTEDKDAAEQWMRHALGYVERGEAMALDIPIAEAVAHQTRIKALAEGRQLAMDLDPKDEATDGVRAALNPKSEAEKLLVGDEDVTPEEMLLGKTDPENLEAERPRSMDEPEQQRIAVMDEQAQPQPIAEVMPNAIRPAFLNGLTPQDQASEISKRIANLEGIKKRNRTQDENLSVYRSLLADIAEKDATVTTAPQAVGDIQAEQVQDMQEQPNRATASPALTDTMVAAQTPDLAEEIRDTEETREIKRRIANLSNIPGKVPPARQAKIDELTAQIQRMAPQTQAPQGVAQSLNPVVKETPTTLPSATVKENLTVVDQPLATSGVVDQNVANVRDKPETVKVRTVYGETLRVRKSDLEGDKPGLRLYRPDGTPAGGYVVRDNLDLDGTKQAERNAATGTPDLVYREDADGMYSFKSKAAAQRELSRRGLTETHEVVDASEMGGKTGFIGRKKADLPSAGTVTAPAKAEASPFEVVDTVKESLGGESYSVKVGDKYVTTGSGGVKLGGKNNAARFNSNVISPEVVFGMIRPTLPADQRTQEQGGGSATAAKSQDKTQDNLDIASVNQGIGAANEEERKAETKALLGDIEAMSPLPQSGAKAYSGENTEAKDEREAEGGTGEQAARRDGEGIQQGDKRRIANNQKADSRIADGGQERRAKEFVYVENRPLIEELLADAQFVTERLVSEGYLTEDEAYAISEQSSNYEETQLWELEEELESLKEVRDHKIKLSKNIVAKILKLGGINHDHAVERMGKNAVIDLRRKFGLAITSKTGKMLDSLALSITESFPDIALGRDMDALVDLLQNRLQPQAKINREYDMSKDAILVTIKDVKEQLAERLAYRDGKIELQGQDVAPDVAETTPATPPISKIDDFGEKIGGARKDTATSTGRTRAKKEKDSRPAWSRRYEVSEIAKSTKPQEEGKFVINDTRVTDRWGNPRASKQLFDTREEAERAIPLVAVSRNHRVRQRDDAYVIMKDVSDRKSVQVVAQQFQTREDAMRYMAEHAAQILEVKTVFGEEIIERPENAVRVGTDRRTGPATAEDFQKTFGFRGVEFGNWNNQEERQEVMNHAYDGLLDLADVLGIPPKAISLNGDLALAFGARGQGLSGAKAHYELDYGVINLTKMSGAGSLAHEWFHAVDHYLGRQDGKASSKKITNNSGNTVYDAKGAESDMVSHGFGFKSAVREELRAAFDNAINTMKRKAEKYVEDAVSVEKWIGTTREQLADELAKVRKNIASQLDPKWYKRNNKPASADQLKQFDMLADRLLSGEGVELQFTMSNGSGRSKFGYGYWTNDTLNAMSEIYKSVRGRSGFRSDKNGPMDGVSPYVTRYLDRIKTYKSAQAGEEKTKFVPTQFMRDSKTLDQGRKGSYFALEHEMAARAFSAYVQDRLTAQQQKSEFLVYGTKTIAPTPWGFVPVFPLGEERVAINEAFDALVKELKTKETDKGVALYQVADTSTPSPLDLRAAFPWADSITEDGDGRTVVTKGKMSFAIEQVEAITPDEVSFKIAYGRKPGAQDLIAGEYKAGTIRLSRVADQWTVQHEYEHFLEDMGLITKFEQAVLDAAIKKAEKDGTLKFSAEQNGQRMKPAELRAYYVQHELASRDFQRKTTLGRVLQKIADFVDALVNLFVRTSRGAVRDVESGAMMGRDSLKADVTEGMRGFQTKEVNPATLTGLRELAQRQVAYLREMDAAIESADGIDIERWTKLSDEMSEARAEIIKRLAEEQKPFVIPLGWGGSIFVHPSSKEKGKWQATRMNANNEPVGDTLYNSAAQAFKDVVDTTSAEDLGMALNGSTRQYFQYSLPSSTTEALQKGREFASDIMHRPEVFGRFKWINTQLHKALRNPAFKRIFDRFHAAAGTQSRSAARAAGLAQDILPDYSGNAKQTIKRLFAKTTDVTREDMRSVSRIMSMETLSGKNASPFAGRRLTDGELAKLERGETVALGGNEIKMTAKQVDLYRQARAALDQMLNEMATSEAWKVMRGVFPEELRDYWEVFANNPDGVQDTMTNMLGTELRNATGRLAQAERAALDFATAKDMEGFAKYGKVLGLLDRAIKNKDNFSKKQLEDGDIDELIAKREEKIDKMADALGITPEDAEERLAEFKRLRKDHTDKARHIENVKDAQAKVADVFDKSRQLIKAGYAPLSRFGKYRIDVKNNDGKLIHVSFYDTSTEAARERRALVAQFADYPDGGNVGDVTTVSEEDWKLFQGANPEALRIFAQNAGADSDATIQAFYQDAVSSRSALKRLINRKGYAGYSDDLQRILASFITSGAKRVASNYHAAEIFDMVNDKTLAADLRDEANKLKQFVDNPGDAGSGFRAFAANYYMLGSFMSAAWNGTQVLSSTLPELYKHSGSVARSAKDIGKAYKSIILKHTDLTDSEKAALKKAMEDGTVDAAEVHHLYAQATKRFIASLGDGAIAEKAGAILRLWGMPFAWFETMNRKASFIAAYRMAEDQGMDVDEAYQFAKQIVDITQGIYVKHNRPNVARSAAGGAILTFMQYKIMTLEQITRNVSGDGKAKRAAALQLAIIMAMGGWAALPFIEDSMDIFDAIMQIVGGKAWLTKKQLREAIEKKSKDAAGRLLEKQAADAVGQVVADFMNIGVVSTVLPVNVSGRAGFGNVVPLVKLLKPSTQYRDSEVFDALGVPGSMAQSLMDASGMLLQGDVGRAAMRLAPNALAAAAKGVDIGLTGEIRNTRGRKITEGSALDAAIQAVGGQPSRKAEINNKMRENQELKYLTQQEERSIVNEWADAYEKKGVVAQSAALKAVRERIADWNRKNPDWPIVVKQSQVMRELQNRRKTTVELAAKSAPKELRKSMAVE